MHLTEAQIIQQLKYTGARANSNLTMAWTDYNAIAMVWPVSHSPQVTYIDKLTDTVEHILEVLDHVVGYGDDEYYEGFRVLRTYLSEFWPPTGEELTWETIVTAWANASKTGRLYTVLTIDEMRKTVWNEEFTSFTLQAPGEE